MSKPQPLTEALRRHYIRRQTGFYTLLLLALAVFMLALYARWQPGMAGSAALLATWALASTVLLWQLQKARQISPNTICRHLNRRYPELEESCLLLLKPAAELSLLERLQLHRIEPALAAITPQQALPVSYKKAWLAVGASAVLTAIILLVPGLPATSPLADRPALHPQATRRIQAALPQIKQISIRVTPPAYTGLKPYEVSQPNFKAEAGAVITWQIQTSGQITSLDLTVSEKQKYAFRPLRQQPGTYVLSHTPAASFLYTLDLNKTRSDFYAVELIKDQVPAITIQKPQQYTEVAFGDPQQLLLSARLTDDYGLQKASLVATVAQGSGEAVKFREVQMPLALQAAGSDKTALIRKKLDLKALGLTYGDELYFYLQAWDRNQGYARSETYFVQLEDTTVITDGADMSLPVSVVPAYFRSQRQLIIDTEKLLAEKKTLSAAAFRERSNDLAADQKILRLRYGKFLGEEAETVIGPKAPADTDDPEQHSADDGHDHGPTEAAPNSPEQLLDPYLHKHDTEEDATYFEPAVKAQLKAALSQMWQAELRLRLSQPAAALPFEYKALRLLKDVQQKSRAYVRKMGFTPPALEEQKKRLTGERDKITAPAIQEERQVNRAYPYIRQVLPWLAALPASGRLTASERVQLQRAGQELAQAALRHPGRYLEALQNLRQLLKEGTPGSAGCYSCRLRVVAAFEALLPQPLPVPAPQKRYRNPLAEHYFKSLK